MITFNISIANPFKYKEFRNLWHRSWAVTQDRTVEVQIYRYTYNLLEFGLDLRWWGDDHAGPKFELGVLGWYVEIGLPSNHHWDRNTSKWEQFFYD
jgi:hypothetical protein